MADAFAVGSSLCVVAGPSLTCAEHAPHFHSFIEGARRAGFNVTIVSAGDDTYTSDAAPSAMVSNSGLDVQYYRPSVPPIEPAHLRLTIDIFRHLRGQQFDAIFFPDRDALGYASIIAKQTGLAFAKTILGVIAFGTSRWERERNHRFPANLVTIATEFTEQQAIEHADVVILSSHEAAAWMESAGWQLGAKFSLTQEAGNTAFESDTWPGIFQKIRAGQSEREAAARDDTNANDVTVVIAHYEQPGLLDQNLEALTRQTARNFSVVVVDDGSKSAEAANYLATIEARYRTLNLRLLRQENRYLGAARNAGIRAANTDFVILLDDDNVAYPDMVKTLRRAIHLTEADTVTCGISAFHDAAEPPRPDMTRSGSDRFFTAGPVLLAAIHNCLGDASAIYRKAIFEKIGYFHELHGVTFEDWQMHLRIVAAGLRLLSVPEPLVWYRVRSGSMLNTTPHYDNARVIASTIDTLPCAMLRPLTDYLIGSELEATALCATTAANSAALLDATRHARNLEEILEQRNKSTKEAEDYARSLEVTLAELQESHRTAGEYAASLERSRAEMEIYAKQLEAELRKVSGTG